MPQKIFIAGAGGYLGPKMVAFFLDQGHTVTALDRFFFGQTLDEYKNHKNFISIKDDIRTFNKKALKNIDVVINLASISNDPASELQPEITRLINFEGAIRLARCAKEEGAKQYIFSSSCSVYGKGNGTVSELSPAHPLSVYAQSKINAESELVKLSDKQFGVTILRMATLFGLSKKRMRFDLIVNLMTLHAWKNKKIFIMGGGKQWRPLVHLDDCIQAFNLVLNEKVKKKIASETFNIGSNDQNYQVFQVANFFRKHFPEITIEVAPDDPDKRSYRVSFDKARKILGFRTKKTIDDGIIEIRDALERGEITDDIRTNTSWYYRYLIEADKTLDAIKINNKLF